MEQHATSNTSPLPQAESKDEKDIDEILSEIGYGFWQLQLIAILCIGSMSDATEVNVLSFICPCAEEEFGLSGVQTSLISGAVFVGELIGGGIFGFLGDWKGRRFSFGISLFLMLSAGIATYFTQSYTQLVACRCLVGIGVGGGVVPFDYLAETVPTKRRGLICMISAVAWGIGSVFTSGMAWALMDSKGWRFLALVCAAPVALVTLLLFTMTESPRWLLSQGRTKEAVQALKYGAWLNQKDLGEFSLRPYNKPNQVGDFRTIFEGNLLKPTILLSIIWLGFGFGYYAIVLVISDIYQISNENCSFDHEDIFLSTLSEPIFIIGALFFIDMSRRLTHSTNYFFAGLFTLIIGLNLNRSFLMVMAFFTRGCIDIASSTTWTVTPEFYPTSIRTSAHALFYVISNIGSFFSGYWVYSGIQTELICILIALICVTTGIAALSLQETAGINIDESKHDDEQVDGSKGRALSKSFAFVRSFSLGSSRNIGGDNSVALI